MRSFTNKHLIIVLLSAIMVTGGVGSLTLFVHPVAVQDSVNGETVQFTADHSTVFASGTCVMVQWQVGIGNDLYLDGLGRDVHGSEKLCINEQQQPTLKVIFRDGSSQEFILPIGFAVRQPLLQTAVCAAALLLTYNMANRWRKPSSRLKALTLGRCCLLVLGLVMLLYLGQVSTVPLVPYSSGDPAPDLSTAWLVSEAVNLVALAGLFSVFSSALLFGSVALPSGPSQDNPRMVTIAERQDPFPLTATLLTFALLTLYINPTWVATTLHNTLASLDNHDGFFTSSANLVSISSVLFLAVLIAFFRQIRWSSPGQNSPSVQRLTIQPQDLLRNYIAPMLPVFVLVAFINIYVNPRGMYGTRLFLPLNVDARRAKIDLYTAMPQTPDLIILGSSRAFAISPEYIQQKLGYTAFNMSVESGVINDVLYLARFVSDQHDRSLPKVLFIEIDPDLPVSDEYLASFAPFRLIPYMDAPAAARTVRTRYEALFDIDQLTEALLVAHYVAVFNAQPRGYLVQPDGMVITYYVPPDLNTVIDQAISSGLPRDCSPTVSPQATHVLSQLIEFARQQRTTLVFYYSPLHPRYYAALQRTISKFDQCAAGYWAFAQSMMRTYDNVFFLDFSRLESIHGSDTVDGYYDYMHMTRANSNRIVDAAADTLRHAYSLSTAWRAEQIAKTNGSRH